VPDDVAPEPEGWPVEAEPDGCDPLRPAVPEGCPVVAAPAVEGWPVVELPAVEGWLVGLPAVVPLGLDAVPLAGACVPDGAVAEVPVPDGGAAGAAVVEVPVPVPAGEAGAAVVEGLVPDGEAPGAAVVEVLVPPAPVVALVPVRVVRVSVEIACTCGGTGAASARGRFWERMVTRVSRSITCGWIAKFTAMPPRRSTRPIGRVSS
jgi:hypothetical protein